MSFSPKKHGLYYAPKNSELEESTELSQNVKTSDYFNRTRSESSRLDGKASFQCIASRVTFKFWGEGDCKDWKYSI